MKKKYCYYAAFFLPVLVFWLAGCTDEFLSSPSVKTGMKDFTLDEAQEYFRSEAEKEGARSRGESEVKALSPGDFVPDWDGAVGSSSSGLACYDIPIEADYRYEAVYAEERHGTMSVERVSVYQKLIIVKDVKSDRMSQYILTLIPSKAYDARYGSSVCDRFITRSDKGGFSGIAVYSCVYSAYTARVDTYKDGVKREGVFLLNGTDRSVSDAKADYARSLVSSLQILRGKRPLSRGEYDGDYYVDYTYDDTYNEIYSGGWLDEIVVTPDPIWDGVGADGLTNDEWMSSTTPDSTVDPSPEDGTSNDTDDVIASDDGGNETEQDSGEPDIQLSRFNASEIFTVKNAISSLQQRFPNLNLNGLSFQKDEWHGLAYLDNGVIQVGLGFFNLPLMSDKASVLWHEIYHLRNGHNAGLEAKEDVEDKFKNVPPNVEKYLKYDIRNDFVGTGTIFSDEDVERLFLNNLDCYQINHSKFYENELETYRAEKEVFPDKIISDDYIEKREYAKWTYEEGLRVAREHGF